MGGIVFELQQAGVEPQHSTEPRSGTKHADARPLRVWEQIGAVMTISYGFELDGFLHGDELRRAWAAVQRRFPYACTSIQECGGAACFVHDPQALALQAALLLLGCLWF